MRARSLRGRGSCAARTSSSTTVVNFLRGAHRAQVVSPCRLCSMSKPVSPSQAAETLGGASIAPARDGTGEVAAKDDYQNPTEVSNRLSQSAELVVDGVQRPSAQHADLVYDQDLFLLPVHPGLPVDTENCRARRCKTVWATCPPHSRDCVFIESTSGLDSDSIDVRRRYVGHCHQ